jgi:hypothetical protein
LDAAVEQARLALEKNPNDPDAIQLQQDIATRRNVLAEQERQKRMMADRAEAERLVAEGNALFPKDLKNAQAKAEEAQRKVANYGPATALLTRISEREKAETQYAMALRGAQSAFDRKDYGKARAELNDVPDEFENTKEVIDLQEDIKRALASTPRPPERIRSTPRPTPRSTQSKKRNNVEPVRNPSTPRPQTYSPPPPPPPPEKQRKPRPTPRLKPPSTGGVIGG